jgi:hypothetical protein
MSEEFINQEGYLIVNNLPILGPCSFKLVPLPELVIQVNEVLAELFIEALVVCIVLDKLIVLIIVIWLAIECISMDICRALVVGILENSALLSHEGLCMRNIINNDIILLLYGTSVQIFLNL